MRTTVVLVLIVTLLALTEGITGAQQTAKVPRIGFLGGAYPRSVIFESFRQGLRELGYVEGQNIILERRPLFGGSAQMHDVVAELVRLPVDVIVAQNTPAIYAAMSATKTIPIVLTFPGDPAAAGLVTSLERPGGNVTGVSGLANELGGKWLELVKEAVPGASRVAVLWNSREGNESRTLKAVEVAARSLGVELQPLEVQSRRELEDTFRSATTWRADAFIVLPSNVFGLNLPEIAYLAVKSRLPGIFWRADFAEAGGLMAYGANRLEQSRRAAYFVDKILKGAKPAELPVELPRNFELVINLKTAKEISLTIPPRVLAWADRVIQ
jgi:putative ABC transport system substrate-binding protein